MLAINIQNRSICYTGPVIKRHIMEARVANLSLSDKAIDCKNYQTIRRLVKLSPAVSINC